MKNKSIYEDIPKSPFAGVKTINLDYKTTHNIDYHHYQNHHLYHTVLRYLKTGNSSYHIDPLEETWAHVDGLNSHPLSKTLSPVARLLLASDGSMTQMLEALTLSTVSITMKRQEVLTVSGDLPIWKEFDGVEKVLDREAWLSGNGMPLIYAHSLLATDNRNYTLESIKEKEKPLGRMLIDDGAKIFRGDLALGLVKSPDVAKDLTLPSHTDFWARHYKLLSDRGLSGIIFELFSPHLFRI